MTTCTWYFETVVLVFKRHRTENLSIVTLLLTLRHITGHRPGRKYFVVWHKWTGRFLVSSGLQKCWLVPSLVDGYVCKSQRKTGHGKDMESVE